MQIIAEYYLIYSQIVFSHLHFCFFRLLPVSLSFRLPCSCLSILIFVHFAYLCSFRLSSFISPELYSGIGSSEPPYIDQAWSISRLSLSSFLSPECHSATPPPQQNCIFSPLIVKKIATLLQMSDFFRIFAVQS